MIETAYPISLVSEEIQAELLDIQASGLFDGAWFVARNHDFATGGLQALVHYHEFGWRESRWPNAYFDTAWYLDCNPDVAQTGQSPLLHYIRHGEREGRKPINHFDPIWYRGAYGVPEGVLCLAHFLAHRCSGLVSPLPEFDPLFYGAQYPDVGWAGMDPFEHYLVRGAQEGRQPAPGFDTGYYRRRYMRHAPADNPVLHYRAHRHLADVHPCATGEETDIPAEVRRNARAGPHFEEFRPLAASAPRRAKLLAYYLPQFHAVPENDAWWGTGFTEWTNVARALPRFVGHYQPRIPRDLGHYRLEGTGVLKRQAEMARAAGLHGFVFYFYWFDGRRLLESPLEALLADPTIDLPFCLMWANENWTRRWDGSEHEVLLEQTYRVADEGALIDTFLRHFADPRYIRLEGRPVLMVYRAGLIPPGAVARWRRLFAARGEDPLFTMAQSFDDRDPRRAGMDAAVEFPPHKLVSGLPLINDRLQPLDHGATAQVFDYEQLAGATDLSPAPYPLIRTVLPGWDNDPRRQGAGMVLHGATPAAYQAWLGRVIAAAQAQRVGNEAIVCINAWNEWGEGAYLEPDVHFGAAFLNATARAVCGEQGAGADLKLLLVGHDAFPAGAQLLLLHLGAALRRRGVDVAFLLLGDGALLPRYRAVAATTILADRAGLAAQARTLMDQGVCAAIVNTSAAAHACRPLAEAGLDCTLLVHELPRLLRANNLVAPAQDAMGVVRRVVFPAAHVRDRFSELVTFEPERGTILPQGLYRAITATDRVQRRKQLRLGKGALLAIGIGYGDLRKGFDLFLQAWRTAAAGSLGIHMLWVGDIEPGIQAYLGGEIAVALASGTFHHVPYAADGADWLIAADILLLTSREDPLPTVVLEAMSVGLPTLAFEESGGIPDLLREHGAGDSVPLGDVNALVGLIHTQVARSPPAVRAARAARAHAEFGFDDYAGQLLALACPDLLPVSVVVPSYNYARYLPGRLGSIFAQTHPVAEVIVLDDASSDDSAAVAERTAREAGRDLQLVRGLRNAGSVFRQWRRAAEFAQSDWLWIAEADDSCRPGFLAALAAAIRTTPDVVMAFTDSRAVDAEGAELWPDHKDYYHQAGAPLLARDAVFDAATFLRTCLAHRNLVLNASAVLWRRSALLAALDRCGAALDDFTMAGDWRLYAELLSVGGSVAYVAQPLNTHRRHAASVTSRLAAVRHVDEVERMQAHMRGLLGPQPGLERVQRRALEETRAALRAGGTGTALRAGK